MIQRLHHADGVAVFCPACAWVGTVGQTHDLDRSVSGDPDEWEGPWHRVCACPKCAAPVEQ